MRRFEPYLLLFILYFVVGRIGLTIAPMWGLATLLWLPSGVALAALVIGGWRLWPAVFAAAFALYATAGAGFFPALFLGVGNTIEALVGTYILSHIVGLHYNLRHVRDNLGLVAVSLVTPIVSTSIATATLVLSGDLPPHTVIEFALVWWIASATGIIIATPFVVKWLKGPKFDRTPAQYAELAVALLAVFLISLFIFWTPTNQLAYYLCIPLTWVALRTGPRGITLALVMASALATIGTLQGNGPYGLTGLFALSVYLYTICALFLTFTSTVEERKEAQKELAKHVDELEQALSKISSEDEAKKNFLAILAHELRNPLAAMLSSVELLRLQKAGSEETPALVHTIGEHVHAMRSMLDDVLDISRISRNKLTLRKEVVALDLIVDRCVHSTESIFRNRRHKLLVHKSPHPLFIEADPIRIEQILVNLLNNAAKYTDPGGRIELSFSRDKGTIAVHVKDNGIGISKSMQKRIFEPFFQIQRGKLATEGLGVGLPLTRQLVDMHKGTIEVKSQGEGRGSEFIVTLPLAAKNQRPAIKPISSAKNKTLRAVKNTRSILVVDDNEAAALAISRLLTLRGHSVRTVYTGTAAVEEARRQPPDILILDIGLPDIDGYEVTHQLLLDPLFPSAIIALTGFGQTEDKEKAINAGFHYHLTKPVGLQELEKTFKKVEHIYAST